MKDLLQKQFGLQVHKNLTINEYNFMLYDVLTRVYYYKCRHDDNTVNSEYIDDTFAAMFLQNSVTDIKHLFNYSRNLKRQFSYINDKGKTHLKIQQSYVGEIIFNELIRCNIIHLEKSGKNNYNNDMSIYSIKQSTVDVLLKSYKKECGGWRISSLFLLFSFSFYHQNSLYGFKNLS